MQLALEIRQGNTFFKALRWTDKVTNLPIDFNNATARMQIRHKVSSEQFIFELTTENGCILLKPEGEINIVLPASVTATFPPGTCVYDLEVVFASTDETEAVVKTPVFGDVTVTAEVTR